jgi:hypothetical protein
LRNEVRYSPGTRSSMLSFGSFGRQSKGTRPVTPASGLSQVSQPGSPAGNEESTFGKLKNFGRRRRASVGDLLSGIQLQGAQSTSGGQRKRTFSRLSVCSSQTSFYFLPSDSHRDYLDGKTLKMQRENLPATRELPRNRFRSKIYRHPHWQMKIWILLALWMINHRFSAILSSKSLFQSSLGNPLRPQRRRTARRLSAPVCRSRPALQILPC